MRLRLKPQETSFYDYFSAQSQIIVEAATLLGELMDGASDRSAVAAKVRDCEHAGDEVTHQILRQLNSTFITPFDREDIYRLASNLDDVLDLMEAAADLVVLYGLDELPRETASLVDVLQRSAAVTAAAMPRLRTLKNLEEYWIEVNELENEADSIYRRLVARLFSGEYEALMVMKLKEVIDQLEGAADAFEHVADAVETIAVKES